MCGRFTREYTWRQVHDFLDLRFPTLAEMAPSWNVAPTQRAPVCRVNGAGERELAPLAWGFVPSWSKDPARSSINARSETVATSPAFRAAFKSRRCLVPASGFYEWTKHPLPGRKKVPYYIRLRSDPIMCFGAIWETHRIDGSEVEGFAILTTRPNPLVGTIHDRMPVIVPPERFAEWLDPKIAAPDPGLFAPSPADRMLMLPVGTRVNSPKVDDPSLINPAPTPASPGPPPPRSAEKSRDDEPGLFG